MAISRQTYADKWRDFSSNFAQLANEEAEAIRKTGKHLGLYACGVYVETPEILRQKGRTQIPRTGQWKLIGGVNESFREIFRSLAVRAGIALGDCPSDTRPEDFWLHRLYSDLCENKSDHLFETSEKGGTISRVCAAAEAFCSRLEAQALKMEVTSNAAQVAALVAPKSWQEVEIAFLSDERVEICNGGNRQTYNYTEFGFADRRSGQPNRAWMMLRELANCAGALPTGTIQGKQLAQVQKRIEQIREKFCDHFGIESDPIPFNGANYQTSFKISRRPSFDT